MEIQSQLFAHSTSSLSVAFQTPRRKRKCIDVGKKRTPQTGVPS